MSDSTPTAGPAPDPQQFDADIALVMQSAIASHHKGEFADAQALYEMILSVKPHYSDALYNLAVLLVQTGKPEAALPHFEAALGIDPNNGQFWVAYINAQIEAGRVAAAWAMIGMCQQRGIRGPAIDGLIQRLSMSTEGQAAAVGTAAAGRSAVVTHAPAAVEMPVNTDARGGARRPTQQDVTRFTALYNKGRYGEAVKHARVMTQRYPASGYAWKSLSNALHKDGQYLAATEPLARATALDPADIVLGTLYADVLRLANRLDESERESRRVIAVDDSYAEGWRVLNMTLLAQGRTTEAIAAGNRSVELAPDSQQMYGSLGVALSELGATAEAELAFRRAHELMPRDAAMHSNLLFCLTHDPHLGSEAIFAEHRRFAEIHEAPVRARWPRHSNKRDPERQLRIGFVSGDLFNHAVSSYLMPILEVLHRDPTLSLHVYHNHTIEDGITARLRGWSDSWLQVSGFTDDRLVEQIRADRIDILLDLSSHTGRNRLPALARKPAPVQISWIGYPGTTGLDAMDYYLADRFGVPFGEMERQFTEKIIHLPAGGTFKPIDNAPPVNLLPALHNGFVTFGSFNRLNKLRPEVIAEWARILHAVPDSRMRVGSIPRVGGVDMLLEWFTAEGITHDRLDLQPRAPVAVYLQQHHHVDFCLDTFPYTGSTTALNALWMGVPTLTIRGNTLASRAGAVWMSSVGLEQFVADSTDDFVARGIALANDVEGLAAVRRGLRERCRQSPGFQPERIANAVSDAFRMAWRRWCADEAPASFTVPERAAAGAGADSAAAEAALTGEA
ncbi:O-linked N-acetylglucosamine transferase family protein [Burkholderia plantarii]|uniref:O-linked N-acetylglucosamine transferase family protein n=1 Tax=Burkholderia plantarii TaxID=41899 RepID=UPI0018DD1BE2|nr:tetratricopeptide repeat protein [Burkholderia plantarii]MBI0326703.1 tetratricopeptide repeat protein [Burkholderia plantarii]